MFEDPKHLKGFKQVGATNQTNDSTISNQVLSKAKPPALPSVEVTGEGSSLAVGQGNKPVFRVSSKRSSMPVKKPIDSINNSKKSLVKDKRKLYDVIHSCLYFMDNKNFGQVEDEIQQRIAKQTKLLTSSLLQESAGSQLSHHVQHMHKVVPTMDKRLRIRRKLATPYLSSKRQESGQKIESEYKESTKSHNGRAQQQKLLKFLEEK